MKHAEMSQSTAVINLKRDATELAAGLRALKQRAAAALDEEFREVRREGEELDVELFFELLVRVVERKREAVDEADEKRWLAGMELLTLRDECRKAKEELYGEAVEVRRRLVELFGSARCRFQLGLAERTPRGAYDLADESGRLARRLARPDLKLPEPAPGVKATPGVWAKALKPGVERVENLLREIEHRQVGSEKRVRERRRIQKSCRETYLLVAHTAEALLTLAGEKELARCLRSSARRRTRRPRRRRSPVVRAVLAGAARLRRLAVTILEWLRRIAGRAAAGLAGPISGRKSGKSRFFRWQRGREGPETPLPAPSESS
jgi:hypothetical protein